MYAATAWAAERARAGHGATLIEHVTYRAGAHSTSDDPSRYRPKDEFPAWPLGDPVERLKKHLIGLGEWDDARHTALLAELETEVAAAWKQAMSYGTNNDGARLDTALMFEDVFKVLPPHLEAQRAELEAELAAARDAGAAT